ncbi:hypothetical protein SteCoe_2082 [Stentor coeruleus]|uniref:Ankyrin repeat protein n=1 Tax=Stentor coeruleus TaxID=5963 RepID=A0A1R2D0F0_9CILI|nr:hypothetical protein SteCoe_2082 [Stentor coeruleus]
MGCSTSFTSKKGLEDILKKTIDIDNYKAMSNILKQEIKSTKNPALVDTHKFFHEGFTFSIFDYALYKGKTNCFKTLYNNFHSSALDLINSYHSQGLDPIYTICISGNIELLSFFFPIYLETKDASDYPLSPSILSPIQISAKHGHISIINYFDKYFKSKPPSEYNVNSCNIYGENAAGVALKEGRYKVLKYIIEKFDSKIEGVNDPLMICLTQAELKPDREYLECAVYAIENLKYLVLKRHIGFLKDNSVLSLYLDRKYNENEGRWANESRDSIATNYSIE